MNLKKDIKRIERSLFGDFPSFADEVLILAKELKLEHLKPDLDYHKRTLWSLCAVDRYPRVQTELLSTYLKWLEKGTFFDKFPRNSRAEHSVTITEYPLLFEYFLLTEKVQKKLISAINLELACR